MRRKYAEKWYRIARNQLPHRVPQNMRYTYFAEICEKCGNKKKYAEIAYSHKNDMPSWEERLRNDL